jgi:hypothetical protein
MLSYRLQNVYKGGTAEWQKGGTATDTVER